MNIFNKLILFSCSLFSVLSATVLAADTPPNIVLILADDLGIENLEVYGGSSYSTPALDQLAADGMRFDYFHANPLCTPSRVKVMTGQYNFRNYETFMVLPKGETTFAHLLKDAGYKTMVAGKWQLVNNPWDDTRGAFPEQAGFNEHRLWQVERDTRGSRYWKPTLVTDGVYETFAEDQFGPDLVNDYVLNYIERNRDERFFIYYPMILPHDPFVATPDQPAAETDEEKYVAMMAYTDKLVGKVRQKLEALGLAENTLVLFAGDNGSSYHVSSVRNGQVVPGGKGATTSNGSHVPFIAWWPGVIEHGRSSDELTNLNDVLPTLLEVAGVTAPANLPVDGQSLLPSLLGEGQIDREQIFIHYEPKVLIFKSARYVFDHRWKLYEDGRFYDMSADYLEQHPLDPESAGEEGARAYGRLNAVLSTMEGGPVSGFYHIPAKMWRRASMVLAMIIALGAVWVAIRRKRVVH